MVLKRHQFFNSNYSNRIRDNKCKTVSSFLITKFVHKASLAFSQAYSGLYAVLDTDQGLTCWTGDAEQNVSDNSRGYSPHREPSTSS